MTERIEPTSPAPDSELLAPPAPPVGGTDAAADAPAASTATGNAPPAPPADETPGVAASPKVSLSDRLPPLRGWGGGLLVGLLLLGLFGWQWFDLRHRVSQTQEQLARRLVEGATQLREARTLAVGAQDALQTQASKITVLEARLAEVTAQQAALEGLFHELSRGRDEWLLAEVDQLVGLAAQQLQFAGNVQGAAAVLSTADARLARSERPQFVTLRKALAKDLQKLRSVPLIDVAGIALKIENAALAADKMALAFEARPQPQPVPAAGRPRANEIVREPTQVDWTHWWKRWSAEVWGEVHNLIRIERFDRPDPAVLAPQNTVFLRENVKLRLLGARLALLGRDQATFKGELRQAVQWLEKYFDPRDRSVVNAIETLKPLLANDLSIEPPTLAESHSALRAVKLAADRIVR